MGGCHFEAGLIVDESAVSPRLGTTRRTPFVPHRHAPFETLRDWECFDAEPGKIPPARFASIHPRLQQLEEAQLIPEAFDRLIADLKSSDSKIK